MSSVVGSCREMCPSKEAKMRLREGLVHFLERTPEEELRMVKEFKRSAAGVELDDPNDLRDLATLQNTVHYLLTKVVLDKRRPYPYVHDFVFDRLRAVRQEIVVQELSTADTLELLEPIILFLASGCCRLKEAGVDATICNQHLQDCLKKALTGYDELMERGRKRRCSDRILIESIYLVFNLGSSDALSRAVSLKSCPDMIEESALFQTAYNISLFVWQGNYYSAIKLTDELPPLLRCLVLSYHVQEWRQILWTRFSHAYNSPNVIVPKEFLGKIMHMDRDDLENCLKHYRIETVGDKNDVVRFSKLTFDQKAAPPKLSNEITSLLCLI